ncbi:hypothetical protein C4J87_1509 [Pseudomonas sp. R1-43-08]|nr:hypothetical protein C4J87_1509 [Pseudomonas sp. R1-43-08]
MTWTASPLSGKHYDMKPIPYVLHRPITTLNVVESIILQDQGRRPFKGSHQRKWKTTL